MRTKQMIAIAVGLLMLLSVVLAVGTMTVSAKAPTGLPTGKITSPTNGAVWVTGEPWTIEYRLGPGSENYEWMLSVRNGNSYWLTDISGSGEFLMPYIQYAGGWQTYGLNRVDPQTGVNTEVDEVSFEAWSGGQPPSEVSGKIISPREGASLVANQPWDFKYSLGEGSENYQWMVIEQRHGGYMLTDVSGHGTFVVPRTLIQSPGEYTITLLRIDPQTGVNAPVDQVFVHVVAK